MLRPGVHVDADIADRAHIIALAARLMEAGLPAETTVAVIENASRREKRLLQAMREQLVG